MKHTVLIVMTALSSPLFAQDARPITIVELFTSQGCSSCPPADVNLSKLAKRKAEDRQIVTLSFHVDYWNRLGWTDPYSDERFTLRQRRYAQVMKLNRIYTPQMVVDGKYEFVGSDSRLVQQAMEQTPAKPQHTLTAKLKTDSETATVVVEIKGPTEGWLVNFAAVQATAENDVPRGENARRHLKHSSIVRAFDVQQAVNRTEATLDLPEDFVHKDARVVVYLQNQSSGAIDGAVVVDFEGR